MWFPACMRRHLCYYSTTVLLSVCPSVMVLVHIWQPWSRRSNQGMVRRLLWCSCPDWSARQNKLSLKSKLQNKLSVKSKLQNKLSLEKQAWWWRLVQRLLWCSWLVRTSDIIYLGNLFGCTFCTCSQLPFGMSSTVQYGMVQCTIPLATVSSYTVPTTCLPLSYKYRASSYQRYVGNCMFIKKIPIDFPHIEFRSFFVFSSYHAPWFQEQLRDFL